MAARSLDATKARAENGRVTTARVLGALGCIALTSSAGIVGTSTWLAPGRSPLLLVAVPLGIASLISVALVVHLLRRQT